MLEQSAADHPTLYEAVLGWIGNRLPGRNSLFLYGLLMLLVATAILAFAWQIAVLVLGRHLQGFSAAVVWASGLALVIDIFGQYLKVR